MQITTIGLDIAKNVFQVHGIDAAEKVIVRKQLRRGQVIAFFEALAPCLVGMRRRQRARRVPSLRFLVKWARQCDSAEQLGEKLRRRYMLQQQSSG